jgi:hypothetical protein
MSYGYQWIADEGGSMKGHYRIADGDDNAVCFCYLLENAQTVVNALNIKLTAAAAITPKDGEVATVVTAALVFAQAELRRWTELYAHLQNECGEVVSRKLDYKLPPAGHLRALEAIEIAIPLSRMHSASASVDLEVIVNAVADEWQVGGISGTIYGRFAIEVAKRALRGSSATRADIVEECAKVCEGFMPSPKALHLQLQRDTLVNVARAIRSHKSFVQ